MTDVVDTLKIENDSIADAAFAAEMADGIPPVQKPGEEVAESQEAHPEVTPPRVEVFAGKTEEELVAALAEIGALKKALDTTNGTYGSKLAEQQRKLDELSQARSISGEMSADKFARLNEEYPDIAAMLASDLSGMIGGSGSVDIDKIADEKAKAFDSTMEKKSLDLEIRFLTMQHKDWREVALIGESGNWVNPKFGEWVASQDSATQQALRESKDAVFLADKISEFKSATKARDVKQNALKSAVMPRGVRVSPDTGSMSAAQVAFEKELRSP